MDQDELRTRLAEITKLVPYIKMVNREKLASRPKDPEEQEGLFTKEEIDRLFREMVSYYIDPQKCQACMTCAKRCPAEAIISAKSQVHVIDQEKCIKCGTCFDVCPPKFGAVTRIRGEPVPPPLPEGKRAIVRKGKSAAPPEP